MNYDDFLLLVSRKVSGEATDMELKELDSFLSTNPEMVEQYQLLLKYWEQQEDSKQLQVEESLNKVLHRLDFPVNNIAEPLIEKRSPVRFIKFSVAAGVAAIVGISIFLFQQKKPADNNSASPLASLEKKQNSKGIKSTIQLADGSKVWLNADSKLQFPQSFQGKTREVYLDGEAFFEVAKNPEKPFIIHLANGTVRVLGTSFNIRAYDNEKVVETSVSTGKVAFIPKYKSSNKKQDTVFLTPDNKVRYLFNTENIAVLPTQAKEDKAWTEGRLIFRAMSLQDISTELERNFGMKTVFLDEEVRNYVLTGSFQNNTLEEIMYYLSLSKTKKFYYKITNNELLIASNADKL